MSPPSPSGSSSPSSHPPTSPMPDEDGPSKTMTTTITERNNKRFASLFLGNLGRPAVVVDAAAPSSNDTHEAEALLVSNQKDLTSWKESSESAVVSSLQSRSSTALSSHQLDAVLSQVDQHIPHDPIALHQTVVYKGALSLLQYQRDNYLVSTNYANQRQAERKQQRSDIAVEASEVATTTPSFKKHHSLLPMRFQKKPREPKASGTTVPPGSDSATSMAHAHLVPLVTGFIPTRTVQTALIPHLTGLVAAPPRLQTTTGGGGDIVGGSAGGGALYTVVSAATTSAIEGQQANLEYVIKHELLQFLENPRNREAMKFSTQGLIIQTTLSPTERVETTSTES